MAERASGRFSRASANSRDTSTPKSASSLHPPHFQPSPGGPLWWESQPQMVEVPSAQERVTAKATPAEAMAWTKADSRVAAETQSPGGSLPSATRVFPSQPPPAAHKPHGKARSYFVKSLMKVPCSGSCQHWGTRRWDGCDFNSGGHACRISQIQDPGFDPAWVLRGEQGISSNLRGLRRELLEKFLIWEPREGLHARG